jgi:hypothetical protein
MKNLVSKESKEEVKSSTSSSKDKKIVKLRKTEPNMFVVPLDKLSDPQVSFLRVFTDFSQELMTGDPYFCKGCGAALSSLSLLKKPSQIAKEKKSTVFSTKFQRNS